MGGERGGQERFREELWLVNAWSISLCSNLFLRAMQLEQSCTQQSRKYFQQKHLRLISLAAHSSPAAPASAWECAWHHLGKEK